MNIIIFIGSLRGGGAEGVVSTLSSELAEKGHRITLVTHLADQKYQVSEHVNLIDKRNWQYNTFEGKLPVRIYRKAANRFLDFYNIYRIIKTEKPDVVISFLVNNLKQILAICKGRIPVISAERNAMVYPHSGKNFLNKHILYRLSDVVQVMSNYDKAWLRDRYKKVVPMPNPLRYEPMDSDVYNSTFGKRRNILACGRIDPQKGFDKLILAFSKISGKHPNWDIDICGAFSPESKHMKYLLDLIHTHNLEDRVHFLGFNKNIDQIMREHSIFCLTSLHEGFPNVLSEAMANGLACLSFDIVTGPSEIINDGLDGIIVEDRNIDEFSYQLSKLIQNTEKRYLLGLHAIENIKRYEKDVIVEKWERMFHRVIRDYKK